MMARAAGHDNAPTIDHLFDPAKGADWHGVGWQNPVADKVTFATGPQASEPSATTALPLDGTTDLGALLGHGPVVLAGTGGAILPARPSGHPARDLGKPSRPRPRAVLPTTAHTKANGPL